MRCFVLCTLAQLFRNSSVLLGTFHQVSSKRAISFLVSSSFFLQSLPLLKYAYGVPTRLNLNENKALLDVKKGEMIKV
jgi:hypothetical protein